MFMGKICTGVALGVMLMATSGTSAAHAATSSTARPDDNCTMCSGQFDSTDTPIFEAPSWASQVLIWATEGDTFQIYCNLPEENGSTIFWYGEDIQLGQLGWVPFYELNDITGPPVPECPPFVF
jgi:hypothetical protein